MSLQKCANFSGPICACAINTRIQPGTSLSQTHKDMSFGDTSHRAHSPQGTLRSTRSDGKQTVQAIVFYHGNCCRQCDLKVF